MGVLLQICYIFSEHLFLRTLCTTASEKSKSCNSNNCFAIFEQAIISDNDVSFKQFYPEKVILNSLKK